MWPKRCVKCGGDLYAETTRYGELELACLQCGKIADDQQVRAYTAWRSWAHGRVEPREMAAPRATAPGLRTLAGPRHSPQPHSPR
jgi:transcription initiation factor TFIIIB Brf1 subunit/transcription initiation factor TFIIB